MALVYGVAGVDMWVHGFSKFPWPTLFVPPSFLSRTPFATLSEPPSNLNLLTDGTTRREPSGWELRSQASSFRPFLPPERATASSTAVKTPLPVPEPPPPTLATNDDDEFDIAVDPELFSYLRFPPSIPRRKTNRPCRRHNTNKVKRWMMDSYQCRRQ